MNSNTYNSLVKIFWTGGFDSTYRIIELSRHNVVIQPFYLVDKKRRSTKNELNSIRRITTDIENHPHTRCKILPLITQEVSELHQDTEITKAYQNLIDIAYIGPQYIWLAKFARYHKGLEICIEAAEYLVGAGYFLFKYGQFIKINEGNITYYILDENNSSKDVFTIFGSFHFPILDLTKKQMLEKYKELGFYETMKKTWFCHTPINGEACGVCNPCKQVIQSGLEIRITTAGMARFKRDEYYKKYWWFKYWKKMRNKIYGY